MPETVLPSAHASQAKCVIMVLLLSTGPAAIHVSLLSHYKLTCYLSCTCFPVAGVYELLATCVV